MNTQTLGATLAAGQVNGPAASQLKAGLLEAKAKQGGSPDDELRKKFDEFVGETFYSQMLSSMRKTVGKPAYFHGGRAEEIFQGQMDQILSEKLTESSGDTFSGPMFELFALSRK